MNNDLAINELTELRDRIDAAIKRLAAAQPKPLPGYRAGGDANGTSRQRYFVASYAQLRALLGEPQHSDGYKVSTEWTLTHEASGACVTLYDYKATRLYDDDLPSVEEFRAQDAYEWHIGAHSRADAATFAIALQTALDRAAEG